MIKNDFRVFNFDLYDIRAMLVDDEPWFVAKDICDALDITDVSVAMRRLDDDEKLIRTIYGSGQGREMSLINESGLYSLVLTSRKHEAREFKRWITHEVIPSIRKHGIYATDTVINNILQDPDFGIKLLTELKQERSQRERLEIETAQQQEVIEELEPKGEYYDNVLQSETGFPITEIAKEYGLEGRCLNQMLHTLGIQYHVGRVWVLTKPYCGKGYTKTKTYPKPNKKSVSHTYWTEKGRQFIYELLKDKLSLLPIRER